MKDNLFRGVAIWSDRPNLKSDPIRKDSDPIRSDRAIHEGDLIVNLRMKYMTKINSILNIFIFLLLYISHYLIISMYNIYMYIYHYYLKKSLLIHIIRIIFMMFVNIILMLKHFYYVIMLNFIYDVFKHILLKKS